MWLVDKNVKIFCYSDKTEKKKTLTFEKLALVFDT